MAHKSYEELEEMLHWATTYATVGGHYRHYKDPMTYYTVTGYCVLEETDEVAVRYVSSERPKVEFVRPIAVWLESVEWNGAHMARFTKIS